ncbi:MAG: ATP-binding protein [Phycisphaerales bacterium]|nr:MAG: ATP-binding protein [Phycisphaerales bacterium]
MSATRTAPDYATAHIKLELLSDPIYLSGAREMVSAVSRRLGFDEVTCCQIALAVDEALANIICHGYNRRTDGKIWLYLWPGDGAPGSPTVRIVIEDEARQVDIEKIKSRDLKDVRPGGLGVHIIKEVMDEVVYEKRQKTGMRLTMAKSVCACDNNTGGHRDA